MTSSRTLLRTLEALALLAGATYVFASRAPTWLYQAALNPDEAQMAANALLVRAGAWTWSGLDGTTSGPPNAIALAWPYLFGLDVTLSTTRLTSTVALVVILLLTYAGLRQALPARSAILCVLPAFLFVGGTRHTDFLHYSSEQTPLLLLMPGVCCCMRRFDAWRRRWLFVPYLAAFAVGMAPFAKLQASPLAAVVLAALLLRVCELPTGQRRTTAALLLGCASVPTVLFLGPLVVAGDLQHFMNPYIRWTRVYMSAPLSRSAVTELLKADAVFHAAAVCALIASTAGIILWAFRPRRPDLETAKQLTFSWLLLAAAGFSVIAPGRMYPHYLLFLVPTGVLAAGMLLAVVDRTASRGRLIRWLPDAIAIVAACAIVVPAAVQSGRTRPHRVRVNDVFRTQSPAILGWLSPRPDDALMVWGWMPEWYVKAGLRPATRETHTESHMKASPMRDYFRQRFVEDFDRSRPAYAIDAVAHGSFVFEDAETDGVASFPALAQAIDEGFVGITDPSLGSRCPRLYVRSERWTALSDRLIPIARATATARLAAGTRHVGPERMIDNALFETCDDFWLLPDGTTGSAIVEFAESSPVARVWLLNTANGHAGDRASQRVRINALRGGAIVRAEETDMAPYPEWTIVDLPAPAIDAVRVDVLSYRGKGGGLNEIKIIRN